MASPKPPSNISYEPLPGFTQHRTSDKINLCGLAISRRTLSLSTAGLAICALFYSFTPPSASTKTLSYISNWTKPRLGTQAWLDRYPGPEPGPNPLPEWLDALARAKDLELIPDIPIGKLDGNGLSQYPASLDLNERVCSFRRTGCLGYDDITDLPKNRWALNFDDGPLPPSKALYEFLDEHDKKATHFWIGHNVKMNSELALQAAKRGDHLAVHTWSHPHLTTYTDEEVVGELGWAMKIIEDISGHRPKYFRPPYGDIDNRVRALAKHVLGMSAVMWNADSCDWSLNLTLATGDFVDPPMRSWGMEQSVNEIEHEMRTARNRREGVIILEHELSDQSVEAFKQTFPLLRELAWTTGTVADLADMPWYQSLTEDD